MTGKYEIRYLPAAQQDLTDILDYIKLDNLSAAHKLIQDIDTAISALEEFPNMGAPLSDMRLRSLNYRALIIGNYLVFYVIKDEIVEIRRILHGKRKYAFLL